MRISDFGLPLSLMHQPSAFDMLAGLPTAVNSPSVFDQLARFALPPANNDLASLFPGLSQAITPMMPLPVTSTFQALANVQATVPRRGVFEEVIRPLLGFAFSLEYSGDSPMGMLFLFVGPFVMFPAVFTIALAAFTIFKLRAEAGEQEQEGTTDTHTDHIARTFE